MSIQASGLLTELENAFADQFQKAKGVPIPQAGSEDRRILLAAVAAGLLRYLANHQGELIESFHLSIDGGTPANYTVSDTSLDIDVNI
jgi:hypothetical protein